MKFLKRWKTRILLFFAVVGPGFITANVDNDANGIYTYSAAGAQFGHMLLWTLIPITLALIVVQEICARMGAVTGKGLSDLIREEFGLRITFFMMLGILIINFGNVVGEFAGIAGSLELFRPLAIHYRSGVRRDRLAAWWSRATTRAWKKFFWPRRFSMSPIFLPVSSQSPPGSTRWWRP